MASDKAGIPDIFDAAADNDVEALKIAVQHVDINSRNPYHAQMTALHFAAVNLAFDTVDFLLAQPGIDPELLDERGWNACLAVMSTRMGERAAQMAARLVEPCFAAEIAEFERRGKDFRREFKVLQGGKADKPRDPSPFGS